MKVSIAFSLYQNGIGNYFTLDDTMKGVLDNVTYTLAGDVLVDVTADVRSVQIKRGRNRQLGRFTSGAANLTLSNASRKYDPLYAATTATRTNLVTNPSFEVDTAGWGSMGGSPTRITSDAYFGAASCQMSYGGTGTTAGIQNNVAFTPVMALSTYTFSFYARQSAVTGALIYNVMWYASDGVTLVQDGSHSAPTPTTAWARYSQTVTAPAGASYAFVRIYKTSGEAGGATAATVFVDGILFEQSSTLNPYFDGTTTDGTIRLVSQAWNGTANASTSTITYYVNGTGSPYYGSIVPGKQVVIEHNGFPLYTGTVADWNLDYDLGGDNTAQASCTDGLASIANQLVTAGTATAQATGARVGAYLTDVGWPVAARSISTGAATLGADVIGANTNAITYLTAAVDSDPGALFVSKTGLMTFRDRNDLQAFTSGATFGPAAIPFTNIEVEYGVETLYPTVNVNYWGGTAVASVSVSDATAVTNYGNAELTVDTLLGSVTDATDLGNYLVGKYANPVYRINGLTVALHGLDSASVNTVLALELGDMILVDGWAPGGVGTAISQYLTVEGIEHDADPSQHFVTFTLSQTLASFQLDSTTFGVLDTNRIGF